MVVTLGLLLASGGWGSGMLLSTPQYPRWPLPLPAETYPAPNVSGSDTVPVPVRAFPAFGEGMGTQTQARREETDPEEHRLPAQAWRPGRRSPSAGMGLGTAWRAGRTQDVVPSLSGGVEKSWGA